MYHVTFVDIRDTKKLHNIFCYCASVTAASKNMYNVANFYIRNLMTGLNKPEMKRTDNEKEVIRIVEGSVPLLNEISRVSCEKRRKKVEKRQDLSPKEREKKLKEIRQAVYHMPTAEQWFPGYELLDGVFRLTENTDYRAAYSHIMQNAIKECVQNWESYFSNKNAGRKVHIPRYKKALHATAVTNNTGCRFEGRYLVIPGIREWLPVGELPRKEEKLIQLRIRPYFDLYRIEIVTDDGKNEEETETVTEFGEDYGAMMVDPGVRNFVSISDNKGNPPIVIKGGYLKSVNRQYNRRSAKLKSIQMKGHDPKKYHPEDTKQMQAVARKRDAILRDMFYKISHFLCRTAVERKLQVLIVGKNKGWKQEVCLGDANNQNFVMLPYARFFRILSCVAVQYGLYVVSQEESYTSKASFLDQDPIPDYGDDHARYISFSGARKKGIYCSGDGTLLNADVNGACNIGRKYDPWIFPEGFDRKKMAETTIGIGYRTFHPEA